MFFLEENQFLLLINIYVYLPNSLREQDTTQRLFSYGV